MVVHPHRIFCPQALKLLWRKAMGSCKMHKSSIKCINSPEYAAAKRNKIPRDRIEYGLNVRWRTRNDAQYLRGCRLLLQRFITLACEQRNPLSCIGSGRLATTSGLRRIASPHRLAVLRFCCFAACFVGPSHCLPRGSGQGIVPTQTSTPEGVGEEGQ